ncbi:MAG: EF-hand domain-containing protein [Acetobacteraceae bacterium]|nr:EF-hand domain-containing protein [Acetobacteraceae bacterium]
MRHPAVATLALALLTAGCAAGGPHGGGPERSAWMFERLDADRDGRVTWAEAWGAAAARFDAADTDRSGGLTLAEFQAQTVPRPDGAPEPSARMVERRAERRARRFRALDANQDGQVTLAEMRPFAQARFRAMDANGDGAVTLDELPRRGPRPATAAPAQPR